MSSTGSTTYLMDDNPNTSPPPSEHAPNIADEGDVGLLDPRHSERRRHMLSVINRMRSTGAQLDLDLPLIAVIGSQSAGKSSLIESISGIKLPRASGTCTRCPTECLLTRSSDPWRCVVSLRLVTDKMGAPLSQPMTIEFGSPILNKADVADRIRRAQLAILNPSIDPQTFLDSLPEDVNKRELSFSTNSVCLHIYGKDLEDLIFVDLPGFIVGGNPVDSALVQQLAETYIAKPSCIILVTVACETDYENQSAHRLAEKFDPEGARTIGVLTKVDRIPRGEEDSWIQFLDSESSDNKIDYFCIKNPDSQAIKGGITWEQARVRERQFFSEEGPWATLDWIYSQRLGTDNLTARLARTLTDLITRRLPELQSELDKLLTATEASIAHLPPPPSAEPVAEILRLVGVFSRAIEREIEGVPCEDGLHQTLRPAQIKFQKSIRITAPDFRPLERPRKPPGKTIPMSPAPVPAFLANEENGDELEPRDGSKAIYVDDVMSKIRGAVTRELPNDVPFIVKKQLIHEAVSKWGLPSRDLFQVTLQTLRSRVIAIIAEVFQQFEFLKQRVTHIFTEHLRGRAEETQKRLGYLQEMEKQPFTRNDHYFSDYRDKFLTHYKALRHKDTHSFIRQIDDPSSRGEAFNEILNQAMASIHNLGLHEFQPGDIPRLLPPDPMEAAIGIMADVRAYFQVAYKRYVDNVPMTIDHTLVSGVIDGLEMALFTGLGAKGSGCYERCQRLLEEPQDISHRRDELLKRRDRLVRARDEMLEVFII